MVNLKENLPFPSLIAVNETPLIAGAEPSCDGYFLSSLIIFLNYKTVVILLKRDYDNIIT